MNHRRSPPQLAKLTRRVPSAPITSANILSQQAQRREVQRPLRFTNLQLNELITNPLSLADYDTRYSPMSPMFPSCRRNHDQFKPGALHS
jgi:hypothetical protein